MTGFALVLRYWYFAAIAVLVLMVGGQQVRVSNAKSQTAAVRAQLADYKTAAETAARKAEAAARARETQLQEQTDAITADAKQQADEAIRAVSLADAAADSLRKRVAALVAADRASANPRPAGRGPSEQIDDPIGMLSDLLGRIDERQGVVAAYADRLRVAGTACERWAETLKP